MLRAFQSTVTVLSTLSVLFVAQSALGLSETPIWAKVVNSSAPEITEFEIPLSDLELQNVRPACPDNTDNFADSLGGSRGSSPIVMPSPVPQPPKSPPPPAPPSSSPPGFANVGKFFWDLIQQGKAVVNVRTDYVSALPTGVCWNQLENWREPLVRSLRVVYRNAYGWEVVTLAIKVIATTGGSYKGNGQYLANAIVLPAVKANWGFNVSAEAVVPEIINLGTTANPIAAAQIDVRWKITAFAGMQDIEDHLSFFAAGDGRLDVLAD